MFTKSQIEDLESIATMFEGKAKEAPYTNKKPEQQRRLDAAMQLALMAEFFGMVYVSATKEGRKNHITMQHINSLNRRLMEAKLGRIALSVFRSPDEKFFCGLTLRVTVEGQKLTELVNPDTLKSMPYRIVCEKTKERSDPALDPLMITTPGSGMSI